MRIEDKYQRAALKYQIRRAKELHAKRVRRNLFVQKHRAKILALSIDGWPRTRKMKDFNKWLDLIYQAKIEGIYSFGTSNCDVIANLNRFAKAKSKS